MPYKTFNKIYSILQFENQESPSSEFEHGRHASLWRIDFLFSNCMSALIYRAPLPPLDPLKIFGNTRNSKIVAEKDVICAAQNLIHPKILLTSPKNQFLDKWP